jgi:hypothetical protein
MVTSVCPQRFPIVQRVEVLASKRHAMGRTGLTLPWAEAFNRVTSVGKSCCSRDLHRYRVRSTCRRSDAAEASASWYVGMSDVSCVGMLVCWMFA